MQNVTGVDVGLDLLYNMKKLKMTNRKQGDESGTMRKPNDKVLEIILDCIKDKLNNKSVSVDEDDMLEGLLEKSVENVITIATLIHKKKTKNIDIDL